MFGPDNFPKPNLQLKIAVFFDYRGVEQSSKYAGLSHVRGRIIAVFGARL